MTWVYTLYPIELGEGATSEVFLGENVQTKNQVAIKILSKKTASLNYFANIENEIAVLKKLRGVNGVVQLVDVFSSQESRLFVQNFDVVYPARDQQTVVQVFNLLHGQNLLDLFFQNGEHLYPRQDRETIIKSLLLQICLILQQVHSRGVAHLDIKLDNIMCDPSTGKVTIIDFGYSQIQEENDSKSLSWRIGSLEYNSPEVLYQDDAYDGKKADMFSLGVLLYVLMCGEFPLERSVNSVSDRVGGITFPFWLSPQIVSLMGGMMRSEPGERFSISQAIRH